eukprot:9425677-Pyramimonas_sp.AAC.1
MVGKREGQTRTRRGIGRTGRGTALHTCWWDTLPRRPPVTLNNCWWGYPAPSPWFWTCWLRSLRLASLCDQFNVLESPPRSRLRDVGPWLAQPSQNDEEAAHRSRAAPKQGTQSREADHQTTPEVHD